MGVLALTLSTFAARGAGQALPAQESTHPGDLLRIYLLTAEPGDQVWERFGHDGIRVVNDLDGTDIVWDWGRFNFDQVDFIPRLARGTMLYWMDGQPYQDFLYQYRVTGRAVWAQELDLTAEERWRLYQAILIHALEENRFYRYDYYLDNCSTRIRDVIDGAIGGRIEELLANRITDGTFRSHTRRLFRDVPSAYLGIQFVLGNLADEPITVWDEMFLPLRLRESLGSVTVLRNGVEVPLVKEEVQLLPSEREAWPMSVPERGFVFLVVGVLWGGFIALAGRWAAGGTVLGRSALAVAAGSWSLLAGLAGAVLLAAWIWTDHIFWGWNENLLQANPVLLLVAGALPLLLFRSALPRWVVRLAISIAAVSIAGVVLQLLPGLDQVNGEILALAVPPNLALAWALLNMGKGTDASSPG